MWVMPVCVQRPNLLQDRDNQRMKHLLQIALPRQDAVDMVKGSSVVPADASPNHNRATSKGDHSLDCFGFKVLPWTPPHTGPTIIRSKRSGFHQ